MTLIRGAMAGLVGAVLLAAVPALAAADEPPVPGGGPAFGQHVSSMAPEHPREHGAMLGQCVSTMARTGECPHHD